jgi:transcriptional regulator with XRE-family HTH domain
MKTLQEWRAERVMSVRDLAEAAGAGHKTIIDIEHGRRRPHRRTMRRIAEVLGVSPHEVTEFAEVLREDVQGGERAAA